MYSVCSDALAAGKTNGLPVSRENAFALVTKDAVSRAPAPIRKCRRSSMDALLRLHTCIGERPTVARMGHIVIHHLCRSGWLAGQKRPLWMRLHVYRWNDRRSSRNQRRDD